MITPQDIHLLREALAYWARHAVGLELADSADSISECQVDVQERDIVALYELLTPTSLRYNVVDRMTNEAINTRLFRKVPKLHPVSDRLQVRTVIG